jgi:hypothetical protein
VNASWGLGCRGAGFLPAVDESFIAMVETGLTLWATFSPRIRAPLRLHTMTSGRTPLEELRTHPAAPTEWGWSRGERRLCRALIQFALTAE